MTELMSKIVFNTVSARKGKEKKIKKVGKDHWKTTTVYSQVSDRLRGGVSFFARYFPKEVQRIKAPYTHRYIHIQYFVCTVVVNRIRDL